MTEKKICLTNVVCQVTCSVHGATTVTYTVGATGFDFNGNAIVRVGDTGTIACVPLDTATASTGSSIIDISGTYVHRVGDTGTTGHGTYTVTDTTSSVFAAG